MTRDALMTYVTGFRFTKICTTCGNVLTGTNALDRNVSKSIVINETLSTIVELLATIPYKANTQLKAHPKNTSSNTTTTTQPNAAAGRHPNKSHVVNDATAAINKRKISANSCPANGAMWAIGNDFKRS